MPSKAIVAMVLVCGYSLFGRTFAYIGIPPMKIFIGELALFAFLLFCGGSLVGPWVRGLVTQTPLSALYWAYLMFLSYGIFEFARGLTLGYSPITAAQTFIFNIYPLYFFWGLTAALSNPLLLWRVIRYVTWGSCIYAAIYFLGLKQITTTIPGSDIPIVSVPGGMGLALLALPCFVNDLRRWWLPLSASVFFVLAGQIRAEWTAMFVAVTLQCILLKKMERLVLGSTLLLALLLVGYWTDVSIPSPSGRGGAISTRELAGRAVASFDKDAAREISSKNADFYAGTISWRQKWWTAIWADVHSDIEIALFGRGYGFSLRDLVSYLRHNEVRTPHNMFFFALGYTGWIGVVFFFAFQGALGLTMWRVWTQTGQAFGIVFWASTMIGSLFGSFFETPFGAIPFYLVIGMTTAELVRSTERAEASCCDSSATLQMAQTVVPVDANRALVLFPARTTQG